MSSYDIPETPADLAYRDECNRMHEEACAREEFNYEDPRLKLPVTTRYAHLKRGYCCKSGCRHCPYGFQRK